MGVVDPFFFSSPSAIATTLARQFGSGAMYKHLATTLQEALWGLVLGFVGGAVLAWLATRSEVLADLVDPLLLLLNSVPRIVLAPIFVLWLGIGIGSKIAVAFFLVFVVIFFAVAAGIREVDRALIQRVVVRLDAPPARRSLVPSVPSWVFASLRVAVGFAFTAPSWASSSAPAAGSATS